MVFLGRDDPKYNVVWFKKGNEAVEFIRWDGTGQQDKLYQFLLDLMSTSL